MAFLSTAKHLGWPFKGLISWLGEMFGENKWTVTFCPARRWSLHLAGVIPVRVEGKGGTGAGLIRDRPAAALSLAERLADPCCLIGTGSLLTRASYQQGKQTVSAVHCSDQLSTVPRKAHRSCPGNTWPINAKKWKADVFLMRTIKLMSKLHPRRCSLRRASAEWMEGCI